MVETGGRAFLTYRELTRVARVAFQTALEIVFESETGNIERERPLEMIRV